MTISRIAALSLALSAACAAQALGDTRVIDFDHDAWGEPIASGSTFALQYAAWGVAASPNAYSGANTAGTSGSWASNSDMTISTDAGLTARPDGGNFVHSLTGWLSEDGDPSFELSFLYRIDAISAVFTGIGTGNSFSGIIAYNDLDEVIAEVRVQDPAQGGAFTQTLALNNLNAASRVVIVPGTFDDWVGVDDITFRDAVIPTPGAAALMGLGGVLAARRRRTRA